MARLPRLQSRLILLAGMTVLPILLLSGGLAFFLIQHEIALFRQAALSRNRTFLTASDAQVIGYIATLRALAASNSLEGDNLQTFYAEARRVLDSQPDWRNILLLSPAGQELINLRFKFGDSLPRETLYPENLRTAVTSKQSTVGQLAPGPHVDTLGIAVRVPILRGDHVRYVVQCILRPEALNALLALQQYSTDWTIALLDGNQRFISRQPFRAPGELPSADLRAALNRANDAWYRGQTLEGRDSYTALSTSNLTHWTVAVAIPVNRIHQVAYQAAGIMLVAALGSLLLVRCSPRMIRKRSRVRPMGADDEGKALHRRADHRGAERG
jgi:hypothetical protein